MPLEAVSLAGAALVQVRVHAVTKDGRAGPAGLTWPRNLSFCGYTLLRGAAALDKGLRRGGAPPADEQLRVGDAARSSAALRAPL